MSARAAVRAVLVVLSLQGLGSACSPSIYSKIQFSAGQARLSLAHLPEQGWSKARVLQQVGAPGELLPQPDGDIFVYRLRLVDQIVWNFDTRYFAPVSIPLYVDVKGERWDRTLFVTFDRSGRVSSTAVAAR